MSVSAFISSLMLENTCCHRNQMVVFICSYERHAIRLAAITQCKLLFSLETKVGLIKLNNHAFFVESRA